MGRTNLIDKDKAIFLAQCCKIAYNQLKQDGIFEVPEGYNLVHSFKAKVFNKKEWFGYILQSFHETILVFRGTDSDIDWVADAIFYQVPYPYVNGQGKVHGGFLSIYDSCREEIIEALKTVHPLKKLYITGHSLGGALATLSTIDLAHVFPQKDIVLYNYGSPRVGDLDFMNLFYQYNPRAIRFVNHFDLVPHLPPAKIFNFINKKTYNYRHIFSPYYFAKPALSVEGNHSIDTYIAAMENL